MSTKIKQLTGRMLRPLGRMLAKAIQVDDPWSRHPAEIPPEKFGPGNIHDWSWYFEQRSDVHIKTIKALCRWLARCKYAYDEALFNEPDFWQHPLTFETMRKGDCEDHSNLKTYRYDGALVAAKKRFAAMD